VRTLFFQIFFFFWLATALVLGLFELTSERPRAAQVRTAWHSMVSHALADNAFGVTHAYTERGCEGLRTYAADFQPGPRVHHFLFDEQGKEVCNQAVPANAQALAVAARHTGKLEFASTGDERFAALLQSTPGGASYVYVAELPRMPPPPLWEIAERLALAILASGLVSLLLAYYLAAPIRRLRTAAQRIEEGDLTARAGGRPRRDEVGELVRDFDRMAAQLESLIEAQGRLVRDVSHELRSPLARLSVALGLARQQSSPAAAASLDRIERETERLNQLIQRLLTLSRLEAGDELHQPEEFRFDELVKEAAADADFEARSRGGRVECKQLEPCRVTGNPELLRSAVENILRNAIHYTDPGTPVEVQLDGVRASNMSCILKVRDHGPGVPEAELANLFRPFYRLDQARERHTGGVGLGLAISERAFKLHGGSISASNAAGGGLEIRISLPALA